MSDWREIWPRFVALEPEEQWAVMHEMNFTCTKTFHPMYANSDAGMLYECLDMEGDEDLVREFIDAWRSIHGAAPQELQRAIKAFSALRTIHKWDVVEEVFVPGTFSGMLDDRGLVHRMGEVLVSSAASIPHVLKACEEAQLSRRRRRYRR